MPLSDIALSACSTFSPFITFTDLSQSHCINYFLTYRIHFLGIPRSSVEYYFIHLLEFVLFSPKSFSKWSSSAVVSCIFEVPCSFLLLSLSSHDYLPDIVSKRYCSIIPQSPHPKSSSYHPHHSLSPLTLTNEHPYPLQGKDRYLRRTTPTTAIPTDVSIPEPTKRQPTPSNTPPSGKPSKNRRTTNSARRAK